VKAETTNILPEEPERGEDASDLETINSHAAELNGEAADVLEYQVIPEDG
jgi:hypothetical protein